MQTTDPLWWKLFRASSVKEAGFYGLIHTGIRVKAGVVINIAVADAFLHERVNVPRMKPRLLGEVSAS